MELVSTNEWQDCYRIVNGYLFVVNKFMQRNVFSLDYKIPKNYYKKLNHGVSNDLWISTRRIRFTDKYGIYSDNEEDEFPIGTVFYNQIPVNRTDNIYEFDFIVKAAWNNMCGNFEYWDNIANETKQIVELYKEKYSEIVSKYSV